MKALLIHNPTAGRGDTTREELVDLLHKAGYTPAYQSKRVGELTAALSEPADVVVIAGGDGTVAKVLAQMPDRDVPVAILPLGTANNIASSFGIGGPLAEIAVRLRNAERRKLDIGLASGPWGRSFFVEGAGLGALVRLAEGFSKSGGSRADKIDAARRALRKLLKNIEPDRVEVLLDDQPLPSRHLMVEVLNIAYGGPRLLFGPHVDPGDGLLDVLVLEAGRREDMRRWLKDEPSGRPPMTHLRGKKISIVWDGTPLRVGDDLPSPPEGLAAVELELTPRSATILVPAVEGEPGVAE